MSAVKTEKKVFIPIFIDGEPSRVARNMPALHDISLHPMEVWSNLDTGDTATLMEVQYKAETLNKIHADFTATKNDDPDQKSLLGPDLYHLYEEQEQETQGTDEVDTKDTTAQKPPKPTMIWWQNLLEKKIQITLDELDWSYSPQEDILERALHHLMEETGNRWTRRIHPQGVPLQWSFSKPAHMSFPIVEDVNVIQK